MMAVTNLFIVGEPTNGPLIAQRFIDEFEQHKKEMHANEDCPEDPAVLRIIDHVLANGLDLRKFQRKVIDTFDHYAMTFYDDDLVEQLIEGNETPDMHDVIKIVTEFQKNEPNFTVQSLIPLDLKGTFGFVVKAVTNGHPKV
jgi:hypothetical protein